MKTILGLFLLAAVLTGGASPLPATPCTPSATMQRRGDVTTFVRRHYPGARILDRDTDDGRIEVKIRHEGKEKIVYFTRAGRWLCTEWELRRERLPKAVVSAVARKGFPFRTIDDNDCKAFEDRDGLHYAVIAERGDDDRIFIVTSGGRVVRSFRNDNDDEVLRRYHLRDDGEDRFDEGDDEWDDHSHRRPVRHIHDDGEDHFDEGDDEWDDGED